MKALSPLVILTCFFLGACTDGNLLAVEDPSAAQTADAYTQAHASANACWGQATKVFAQSGAMGRHASEQATPRLGLRNLARVLFEQGILPDDTLQSLGAFVAAELGLEIDACF